MKTRSSRFLVAAAGLCAGLGAAAAQAQEFNKLIGLDINEFGNHVIQTRDGGYAMTGFTQLPNSPDRGDILVNRLAPDGSLLWSVRFGGQDLDIGYHIQQTLDGGFVIAAETSSVGPLLNLALLRLDGAGNYMWSWVHEGDLSGEDSVYAPQRAPGVTVRELRDEAGFVLTGRKRFSENLQDQAGVLVRTAPNGAMVFNRQYGDARFEGRARVSFTDVRQLPDGTFVISGTEEFPDSQVEAQDPLFARLDPAGTPIIFRNYPLPAALNQSEHGTGDGIEVLGTAANPAVVIAGAADRGTLNRDDLHVIRTDPIGGFQFYRRFVDLVPAFRAVHFDMFGKVVVSGTELSTPNNVRDAMLLRVDAGTGAFDLGVSYGYTDFVSMSPTPAKLGYALVGTVAAPAPFGIGGLDIELIQTDGNGDVPCLARRFERTPAAIDIDPPIFLPILGNGVGTFWQANYVRWDQRERIICEDRCVRADFNGDGNIDPDDLGDFINCYFAMPPCPDADFNADGNIDPDDLGDFINLYFECNR
ncbi:MAG: hypothetical protein AB7K52_05760 [Phycisphaerales bacterium]